MGLRDKEVCWEEVRGHRLVVGAGPFTRFYRVSLVQWESKVSSIALCCGADKAEFALEGRHSLD